jgi:hypothetical protein
VVTFHSQGHVDEGRHNVLRYNETRKRKSRIRLKEDKQRKVFFYKDNDVKGKDNGRLWKTKLLRRCGVALVNCDDEERFYRKSNKNRL